MTALPLTQAIENIYTSLHDDNRDIDTHIAALKTALAAEGKKEALFDAKRIATPNREGRKRMEAYFRQRGVTVSFKEKK